jgi:hypothetical protein
MINHVQAGFALLVAERQLLDQYILAAIHAYVEAKSFSFPGRRLKGDDSSARTNEFGGEKRVEAVMRADIEDGHAGAEESLEESALGELKSIISQGGPKIIAASNKPGTEGQAKRNGHVWKKSAHAPANGKIFSPARH